MFVQNPNRPRLISMASEAKESASNNPGLHTTPDEATKGYIMQQTVSPFFFLFLFDLELMGFSKKFFDILCRCFELRIQKSVLTSILVFWACRKFFFSFFFLNVSKFILVKTNFFLKGK